MNEKNGRGFAGMDQARQREIASKGGKAAHQKGTAHRFTSEEARAAGRKGGQEAHIRGTAHEFTVDEARAAGRKGGKAVRERHNAAAPTSKTPAAIESGNGPDTSAQTPAPRSTIPLEQAAQRQEEQEAVATVGSHGG